MIHLHHASSLDDFEIAFICALHLKQNAFEAFFVRKVFPYAGRGFSMCVAYLSVAPDTKHGAFE
jgi:hypothetical protein